jgi:hypothetical protein
MSWFSRLTNVFRSVRLDRDLDAELEFHIEARTDELIAKGLTSEDAAREARRHFGESAGRRGAGLRLRTCRRPGEARKILEEMEQAAATRYLASPQLAVIHLGLGETDRALDRLERGLEERLYFMIYLRADPIYDELRSHPRFTRLLEQVGFPVAREAAPCAAI